jgi:xanthine dehydrogenase large subunit
VREACQALRARLAQVASRRFAVPEADLRFHEAEVSAPGQPPLPFRQLVEQAYLERVPLFETGFYKTPDLHFDPALGRGKPFHYFAYGAAVSEVEVDGFTGQYRLLAVDILHDVGDSLSPLVDRGQIEGGFIQGVGWLTTEQLVWSDNGELATHAPSTYKIPATGDVPEHFRIELWPEPNREDNVGGSKAVGEPPLMLAISVWEALRDAVAAAKGDARPVRMDAPATPENVLRALKQ